MEDILPLQFDSESKVGDTVILIKEDTKVNSEIALRKPH